MSERDLDILPPPERFLRDEVVRVAEQIADFKGDIGCPWRVRNLLWAMRDRGEISESEKEAGERFACDFALASFETLRAPDPGRIPSYGWRGGAEASVSAEQANLRGDPDNPLRHSLSGEGAELLLSPTRKFGRKNYNILPAASIDARPRLRLQRHGEYQCIETNAIDQSEPVQPTL